MSGRFTFNRDVNLIGEQVVAVAYTDGGIRTGGIWADGKQAKRLGFSCLLFAMRREAGSIKILKTVLIGGAITGPLETSNRSELHAMRLAVEYVRPGSRMILSADSTYALKTMRRASESGGPSKFETNRDVVAQIHASIEAKELQIEGRWVRGHSGVKGNEVVDKCASLMKNGLRLNRLVVEFKPTTSYDEILKYISATSRSANSFRGRNLGRDLRSKLDGTGRILELDMEPYETRTT